MDLQDMNDTQRLKSRTALVVDDNVDSARMTEIFLKSQGHKTFVAHSGRQALALFEEANPDFVFLDIGLPDIDGYEVCRLMREQDKGKKITIIAQTGWGQDEHFKKSALAGFDLHLVKPVQPSKIKSLINELDNN
ncbi:MAG: response regulator [Oligoflexus sp.]